MQSVIGPGSHRSYPNVKHAVRTESSVPYPEDSPTSKTVRDKILVPQMHVTIPPTLQALLELRAAYIAGSPWGWSPPCSPGAPDLLSKDLSWGILGNLQA